MLKYFFKSIWPAIAAAMIANTTHALALEDSSPMPKPRPEPVVPVYVNNEGDFAFIICRDAADGTETFSQGLVTCEFGIRIVAKFAGELENGDLFVTVAGTEMRADAPLIEENITLFYNGGAAARGDPNYRETIVFEDNRLSFLGGVWLTTSPQ